jgi:hypothetical protein
MKNLRWRDIMPTKDREGREIVVLFVQGKDKSRKLVAPKSVGDYLERIRTISKASRRQGIHQCHRQARKNSLQLADCGSSERGESARRHAGRSAFDLFLPAYLRHAQIAGGRGRVFPRRADGNFCPHD